MPFYHLRKYYQRKELAGMRPICAHVAVAGALTERISSGFSSSSTSIEHHAILDYVNEVYFHFGSSGLMMTSKVNFEATYGLVNRIVAVPSGQEEGYAILRRARACFEEQARVAWEYNVVTCNCEHFVEHCWTPDAQYSSQVKAFISIVSASAVAAVVAGCYVAIKAANATIPVTVPSVTVEEVSASWGPWAEKVTSVVSSNSTSLHPLVPPLAVAEVSVAFAVGVFTALATAGWIAWRLVQRHKQLTAQMLPIAIENNSTVTIKVGLKNLTNCDACYEVLRGSPGCWAKIQDVLCYFRAGLDVGSMERGINPGTYAEINPASLEDSETHKEFQLEIMELCDNGMVQTLPVSPGDVWTYPALTKVSGPLDYERCIICMENECNVNPWYFCDPSEDRDPFFKTVLAGPFDI
eukprot:Skav217644  [mRNA]  locus=scaffold41:78690:80201:- [translate_table: standard]